MKNSKLPRIFLFRVALKIKETELYFFNFAWYDKYIGKIGKLFRRKTKMKKRKPAKRLLSLCLCAVLLFTGCSGSLFAAKAAEVYSSDYRYWSQGASDIEKLRKYGCWVVAQSKLIYETNVNREESFNPDVYYYWQKDNGFIDSGFYQTNGGYSPVAYSKEKEKPIEYLGYFTATEAKLWENIKNGYYSIVQLNNGGHYVYIDNETSKKKGVLYCFDSWGEQYSYGTRLLSNYKKWDVCYVYKVPDAADLLRPSMPTLSASAKSCVSGGTLTFSWSAVSGADGYRIRILTDGGASVKNEILKNATSAKYSFAKGKYTVFLTAFNSNGDSPESSLNVEAVSGYTVTFNPNGGTCAVKKATVSYGAAYGTLPTPKRTGYKFAGWYTAKSGGTKVTAKTTVKTAANHTLYARWTHTHSYTEKITTPATCEKSGVKTFTCVCGNSYTETVPALEHKYDASTDKATTKEDGLFKVSCVYCGKTVYSSLISKPLSPTVSEKSFHYDGKAHTPAVSVTDKNGKVLYPGAHYNITYKNNTKPGKAVCEVTFVGDYGGTEKILFEILPSAPKNVSSRQNASAITATWDAVYGATGYKVSLFGKNGKLLKTVVTTKTAFRFNSLQSGTKYKIGVRAISKNSDGTVIGESSKIILTATKPAAPQNLSVAAGNGRAKLSWKKVFGATGYTVYYGTKKNSGLKKLSVKKNACAISGLGKNTVYYFKVVANKNVEGKILSSAYSKAVAAKIK